MKAQKSTVLYSNILVWVGHNEVIVFSARKERAHIVMKQNYAYLKRQTLSKAPSYH